MAVYRARANVLVAFGVGWRVVNTPGLGESLLSDQEVKQLVEHDFANYYFENPAADFAFQVWLNNAEVTAICLVLGIAIVPVLVMLWLNIANVGVIGGFMVEAGRADLLYWSAYPAAGHRRHGVAGLSRLRFHPGAAGGPSRGERDVAEELVAPVPTEAA